MIDHTHEGGNPLALLQLHIPKLQNTKMENTIDGKFFALQPDKSYTHTIKVPKPSLLNPMAARSLLKNSRFFELLGQLDEESASKISYDTRYKPFLLNKESLEPIPLEKVVDYLVKIAKLQKI